MQSGRNKTSLDKLSFYSPGEQNRCFSPRWCVEAKPGLAPGGGSGPQGIAELPSKSLAHCLAGLQPPHRRVCRCRRPHCFTCSAIARKTFCDQGFAAYPARSNNQQSEKRKSLRATPGRTVIIFSFHSSFSRAREQSNRAVNAVDSRRRCQPLTFLPFASPTKAWGLGVAGLS
jgi:hypothetical protein